ncbi:sugar kinase [Bacillus sp. MUM 13]|uniref:sugar kinase n=1 Tax=Bacillus sp. MUM 13 TaxID=1678001 RepID=UPI0008F5A9CD|nr:sugar kinase [Bacillus sp. MUM 13]OIK09272.1 2-dehydro-3-deoxygluconokinase [Bacillus sp. MUM 13]
MKELDVVTFGEAMAMFIAAEKGPLHEVKQFNRELAGAETNVAIGLAKLGLRAGWASKVGRDAFGDFIIQRLNSESVDISRVLADKDHPTGFQIKSKVDKGDPEVQYFRKGSAASFLEKSDFSEEYFSKARHLHLTGIPLAISLSAREFSHEALSFMKKEKNTISFDPNLRPGLWNSKQEMIEEINRMAVQADYFLPGIEEGEVLTGFKDPCDIASFYLEKGVKLVVIKLGENGAYYESLKEKGTIPSFKADKVIDTVGAGDGFAVGVISGILENLSVYESVLRGNAIGSLAVQSPGDNDGYPTKDELQDLLNNSLIGGR